MRSKVTRALVSLGVGLAIAVGAVSAAGSTPAPQAPVIGGSVLRTNPLCPPGMARNPGTTTTAWDDDCYYSTPPNS
ncbi:hypothetical protein [Kitasatospora sp. NBC_01266]|uniref:hypothetical protein n=1 Tax=Kitasatospora sp. NBC_01266 TaxID=2903572 RepID=UPI002E320D79|nr:hypothetical protein [Kitasatospora sp. NBC_01266]